MTLIRLLEEIKQMEKPSCLLPGSAKYIELDVAKKAFQNMDAGRKHGSTLLTPEEFAEYLDEFPVADIEYGLKHIELY